MEPLRRSLISEVGFWAWAPETLSVNLLDPDAEADAQEICEEEARKRRDR